MTCEVLELGASEIIDLPHVYTEGDELPELNFTLDDTDLSGYTIQLLIQRDDETVTELDATAVDLTAGRFFFRFRDTDLLPCEVIATLVTQDTASRWATLARFRIKVLERATP